MSPLLAHVLAESACVESFIAALEAEDQALDGRRFGDLPALAERKQSVLDRLARIDEARENAQRQLGVAAGRLGADEASATCPALQHASDTLMERAQRARDLNQVVAAKVYAHLQFTADALSFLKAPLEPFYGRDGSRGIVTGRSSLAIG